MAEEEQQQIIDMTEAVSIAFSRLENLYPNVELRDLLLEEVLLTGYRDRKKPEWEVTLGFARPYSSQTGGSLSNVLPQAKPRSYKRFLIDAQTGNVEGMLDGKIDAD